MFFFLDFEFNSFLISKICANENVAVRADCLFVSFVLWHTAIYLLELSNLCWFRIQLSLYIWRVSS